MTLRLHVKPDARADLEAAVDWYENEEPGVGLRLLDEVDAVLPRVAQSPLQFPIVHKNIRRALLRRFPYGIFFVFEDDTVSILAITHLSRDPSVWMSRQT